MPILCFISYTGVEIHVKILLFNQTNNDVNIVKAFIYFIKLAKRFVKTIYFRGEPSHDRFLLEATTLLGIRGNPQSL